MKQQLKSYLLSKSQSSEFQPSLLEDLPDQETGTWKLSAKSLKIYSSSKAKKCGRSFQWKIMIMELASMNSLTEIHTLTEKIMKESKLKWLKWPLSMKKKWGNSISNPKIRLLNYNASCCRWLSNKQCMVNVLSVVLKLQNLRESKDC